MRFASRVFQLAKDAERPEENQDACQADARRGIAAIADGVASSLFSRRWAQILTRATVAEVPDAGNPQAFGRWLAERRQAWTSQINVSELAWFQKPKLREGAFSTLLWVEVMPLHDTDRRPEDPWRLRVFAVGDSCLFHVRQRELLRSFPVQRAEQLEGSPLVIGSVDLNRDELVKFQSLEEICRPADLLVLCTDAIAEWALRVQEAGSPPVWQRYWSMTQEAWQEEILALRDRREMRHDDATLLLLRVGDGVTAPEQADQATLPAQAAADAPAPPPAPAAEPDWTERLKSFSEQLAGQVSQQVARGLQKLKQVKKSAESALRKYREKRRRDDKNRPNDP
jgi:hypothetical protein